MGYKKIMIAFLLNILFSIIEIIGGVITNSVSIMSDAIHDFGDALSIGISLILEKISKKKPNDKYTYGYIRYSILGAFITTIILTIGSILVIISSVNRLFDPVIINYDGMIVFAILGVIINFFAAYFTKGGKSINQKAVNLHMLEDVLGWVLVLVGSILMKYTDIKLIDSFISIGIALFILINSFKNLKEIIDLFLEKVPSNISIDELKDHLMKIEGVMDVHHVHVWSMDGYNNYSTMHVVIDEKNNVLEIKNKIRNEMLEHGIMHTTIEIEDSKFECDSHACEVLVDPSVHHHHHHH